MPAEASASAVAADKDRPTPARGSAAANAPATVTLMTPRRSAPRLKIHGAVEPIEPSVLASRSRKL